MASRSESSPAPYLLASKIEAFRQRGKEDYLASRDIEDIIALLDGCRDFAERFHRAPAEVRSYLKEQFGEFVRHEQFAGNPSGARREFGHSQIRAGHVLALLKDLSPRAGRTLVHVGPKRRIPALVRR